MMMRRTNVAFIKKRRKRDKGEVENERDSLEERGGELERESDVE